MRTIAVLVSIAAVLVAAQGPNEISNLPGAPTNLGYRQYAGYVNVNAQNGRNLFYWLVESQSSPSTDPLVLWLNGGPGCSSLEGLLTENGPLWINADGQTLSRNPSAWNRIANVVYLESPAGVGFSYSEVESDYTVGDQRTAADTVAFLHQFLLMYPQYQGRDFWVTGESYGGHYVPNACLSIVNANAAGQTPTINIKGFQVGNAWTVAPLDNKGAVDMWWTHGQISDETYDGITVNCDFNNIGPLLSKDEPALPEPQDACQSFLSQSSADQVAINIYDIYTDVCVSQQQTPARRSVVPFPNSGTHLIDTVNRAMGGRSPYAALSQQQQKRFASGAKYVKSGLGDDPDPCIGNHLATYLNTPSVQQAIHANISYAWYGCSPFLNYSYTDLLSSMIPVYQQLLAVQPPLNMLVYSGDVDGIVPIIGTRYWLASLGLDVTTPWHPWLLDQQTGGWSVVYDGLTFASVRNAGHMVPWTEPERSFALFSAFLNGQPI